MLGDNIIHYVNYIYALSDPRDGKIRYVGKANILKRRLQNHLCPSQDKKNFHKAQWLKKMKRENVSPLVTIIAEVPDSEDWQSVERFWIKKLRAEGCDLTNILEGGEGGCTYGHTGRSHSAETRAKISANRRGIKVPPPSEETLKKRAEGIKAAWARRRAQGVETRDGKVVSIETRARLSQSRQSEKARLQFEEVKKKAVEASRGRIHSIESRQKRWKVSDEQAAEIRDKKKSGGRVINLANEYKIATSTVYAICAGKRKHVI